MADGNFLQSMGIDPQLVTAGTAGGFVNAMIAKLKVFETLASMGVGGCVANYGGAPAAALLSSVEVFGMKMNILPEFGGFFVGVFAFLLVGVISAKLRAKFGDKTGAP